VEGSFKRRQMAFQCYDFASNISGRFARTQAHVSKKLGRNIQYLRCLAYSRKIIGHLQRLAKALEALLSFYLAKRTEDGCL